MTTITVEVDDDVYRNFIRLAAEQKNGKKGFLGDAITDAMKSYAGETKRKPAVKGLFAKIRKVCDLGTWMNGLKGTRSTTSIEKTFS